MTIGTAVTTLTAANAATLLPVALAALNVYMASATTGGQIPTQLLGALSNAMRTALGDDVSFNSGPIP